MGEPLRTESRPLRSGKKKGRNRRRNPKRNNYRKEKSTMGGKKVAFDAAIPESMAEDDSGYNVEMTPTGTDDGVDPALDLVRTMSMSTDKDILKQLRDAMNPKQKQQTWIMMFQAFMGMVAVLVLLAVVIVGYISLLRLGSAVGTMADQTSQLKQITQQTSAEMAKLVENLAPVAVM